MKQKIVSILVFTVLFVLLSGCGKKAEEEKQESKESTTFSAYTDIEVYQTIPAMVVEGAKIGDVEDYGDEDYIIPVEGTELEDYKAYVELLEKKGYEKYCDNGEDALEGNVYTTIFTKSKLVVSVTHIVRMNKTLISVSDDTELSEHLIYKDEYLEGNIEGAKTLVHFPELDIINGFSSIIQLKNGHFLVHDGGGAKDGEDLIAYLENLTPEGEKPVIEGWFLSHSHEDHIGAIEEIALDSLLLKSIYIEGIYFFHPSKDNFSIVENSYAEINRMYYALKSFETQDGAEVPIYRPQLGQRYYFNDIIIDVAATLEVLPFESLPMLHYNDTSVFLMHYIEGQKYLTTGDGCHSLQRIALKVFPEEYFNLDVYVVPHHGLNQYYYFTDYCTIKTALYPRGETSVADKAEENAYFQDTIQESYFRPQGDVILTFPYTVGTAEIVN